MSYDFYKPNGEFGKTFGGTRIDLPNKVTIHNPDGLTDLQLNKHGLYRRMDVPEPAYNPVTHRLETQYRQYGAKSRAYHQVLPYAAETRQGRVVELRKRMAQRVRSEAKRRLEEAVPYHEFVLAIVGDKTPDWTDARLIVQRAKEHLYSVKNLDPDRLQAFDPSDDSFWV